MKGAWALGARACAVQRPACCAQTEGADSHVKQCPEYSVAARILCLPYDKNKCCIQVR